MKLAAICCTYRRPEMLANAIACFLAQDLPVSQCEMIVLDDAGQYDNYQLAENITIVSTKRRFRTLGEKRNASAALASDDVTGYCVWDDDDAYLPNHMSIAANLLRGAQLIVPSRTYVERPDGIKIKETSGLYHGGWSFTRGLFDRVRGYPHIQSGQDQAIKQLFLAETMHLTCPVAPITYVYRWGPWAHVSQRGVNYSGMAMAGSGQHVGKIEPRLQRDWASLCRDVK